MRKHTWTIIAVLNNKVRNQKNHTHMFICNEFTFCETIKSTKTAPKMPLELIKVVHIMHQKSITIFKKSVGLVEKSNAKLHKKHASVSRIWKPYCKKCWLCWKTNVKLQKTRESHFLLNTRVQNDKFQIIHNALR